MRCGEAAPRSGDAAPVAELGPAAVGGALPPAAAEPPRWRSLAGEAEADEAAEKERTRVARRPSLPSRVRSSRLLYSSLAGVVSAAPAAVAVVEVEEEGRVAALWWADGDGSVFSFRPPLPVVAGAPSRRSSLKWERSRSSGALLRAGMKRSPTHRPDPLRRPALGDATGDELPLLLLLLLVVVPPPAPPALARRCCGGVCTRTGDCSILASLVLIAIMVRLFFSL